jgi:hypothetical protein
MIHNFGGQYTFHSEVPRTEVGTVEANPQILMHPPALSQSSDIDGRTAILWERGRSAPEEVQEILEPGFHYLDEGVRLYFSDVRIPTPDNVRFMRARVGGGRKDTQIWKDDLDNGRVELPVISIMRGGHKFNPDKFTPAYGAIRKQFVDKSKRHLRLSYRPQPYLVDFTMNLWAETRRDAEYALFQIMSRFNPLAEFKVSDGHNYGTVTLRDASFNSDVDVEAAADQLAKVKYEISCTAEAWLSLPDKVVPTILGQFGNYRMTRVVGPGETIPFDRIKKRS